MKYRARIIRLAIVVATAVLPNSVAIITCFSASNITFSEFPVGTTISTQYSSLGVLFSGSGSGPLIATDRSNPTSPVLSGSPQFFGSITATFVAPSDPAMRATARNVAFDAGYFCNPGSTRVTWFDVNSEALGALVNTGIGIEHITIPETIGSFRIEITGEEPLGFAIDNLSFEIAPQQVRITVADITMDRIEVVLSPDTDSGQLLLTLVGDRNVIVFDGMRNGGTHVFQFDPNNLPEGQFAQVEAVWTVDGTPNRGIRIVAFRVLGRYRHSQYNVPAEATCGGNPARAFITDSSCSFAETTLLHRFIQQVNLNGSGHSINFGDIVREFTCVHQKSAPPGSNGRSFRQQAINPTCAGESLNNSTVARRPGHPFLGCGDRVLIVGLGGGTGTVKTVTDLCPGCPNNQLDNFTTDTACAGIADIGRFVTIRLR